MGEHLTHSHVRWKCLCIRWGKRRDTGKEGQNNSSSRIAETEKGKLVFIFSGPLLMGVQGLLQAQQLARAQAFTYRSTEFTKIPRVALLPSHEPVDLLPIM